MTAETVVLNRMAVALAADSAVTIVSRNGAKATNNADKLFQLTQSDPVGIMIFRNAEFMSMPLEPIIKDFRLSVHSSRKPTLEEYAEAFFKYLENDVTIGEDELSYHMRSSVRNSLQPILRSSLDKLLEQKNRRKESIADKMGMIFLEQIEEEINYIMKKEDCASLNEMTEHQFSDQYVSIIKNYITDITKKNPPSDIVLDQMISKSVEYVRYFLKKNVFSDQSTGIAIAGFGSEDIFPSLYVYDTEGIICGKIKRAPIEKVAINSTDRLGHIASLAQDDVVKRYVEGIDPRIFSEIDRNLQAMMRALGEEFADEWFRGSKRKAFRDRFGEAAERAAISFMADVIGRAKELERQDITDVVHHMSKPELAQLAEALVEMTALRRRVSMDIETVGGPIDVAVISRGDGFVWIKRKHYFDPKLNSRYFDTRRTMMSRSRTDEAK